MYVSWLVTWLILLISFISELDLIFQRNFGLSKRVCNSACVTQPASQWSCRWLCSSSALQSTLSQINKVIWCFVFGSCGDHPYTNNSGRHEAASCQRYYNYCIIIDTLNFSLKSLQLNRVSWALRNYTCENKVMTRVLVDLWNIGLRLILSLLFKPIEIWC